MRKEAISWIRYCASLLVLYVPFPSLTSIILLPSVPSSFLNGRYSSPNYSSHFPSISLFSPLHPSLPQCLLSSIILSAFVSLPAPPPPSLHFTLPLPPTPPPLISSPFSPSRLVPCPLDKLSWKIALPGHTREFPEGRPVLGPLSNQWPFVTYHDNGSHQQLNLFSFSSRPMLRRGGEKTNSSFQTG